MRERESLAALHTKMSTKMFHTIKKILNLGWKTLKTSFHSHVQPNLCMRACTHTHTHKCMHPSTHIHTEYQNYPCTLPASHTQQMKK